MEKEESFQSLVRRYRSWLKVYRNDSAAIMDEADERIKTSRRNLDECSRRIYSKFQVVKRSLNNKGNKQAEYEKKLALFVPLFEDNDLLHFPTLRAAEIWNEIEKKLFKKIEN